MSVLRVALWITLAAATGCGGGENTPPDAQMPDAEPPPPPWVDNGTADQFLGSDVFPEVELTIEPAGIAALEAEPREYVKAMITFQGETFGPIGVHLKGQNSFQPITGKPSLRLKIDEYIPDQTFYGLKDLTFNNMVSDPSMMHERLAYQVARDAGLPASRANHLLLRINGESYGLYTNLETVKKRMIQGHFEDNEGPLFKATDVDFAPPYVDDYELESGADDRTLIEGLAQALTLASPEAALTAASAYVDLDHFRRFWAMESVIGQFDAFPYSVPGDDYYLYADPTSGRLWFVPSGMDETFSAADFSPTQIHSVLAARCSEVPACFQAYVDVAWELQTMTETMGLEQRKIDLQAALAPHIEADTRKPQTPEVITEGQTQLGYFIRYRRTTLGNFLPPPS